MIRIKEIKLELVDIGDNYLIVDGTSTDLENAPILCDFDKKVRFNNNVVKYHGKKIIASKNKIDGIPVLEIEDDGELLIPFPSIQLRDGKEIKSWMDGYEKGYLDSKHNSYSLKDMMKIAQMAFTIKSNNETILEDFQKWFDNKIGNFKKELYIDATVDNLNIVDNKIKAYWN
jgi:hypothetical protein